MLKVVILRVEALKKCVCQPTFDVYPWYFAVVALHVLDVRHHSEVVLEGKSLFL